MKDLLERLRDLVIVAAVDDAFEKRLISVADDQRDRLQSQADRIGVAALTRCSELVALALTELKGPTAPRLQLELVCAKLLLPGAHGDELSLAARLERLERRLAVAPSKIRPCATGKSSAAGSGRAGRACRVCRRAAARRGRADHSKEEPSDEAIARPLLMSLVARLTSMSFDDCGRACWTGSRPTAALRGRSFSRSLRY